MSFSAVSRLRARTFRFNPAGLFELSAEAFLACLAIAIILATVWHGYHELVHHHLFDLQLPGRSEPVEFTPHFLGEALLYSFFAITTIEILGSIAKKAGGLWEGISYPLCLTAGGFLMPIALFLATAEIFAPEMKGAWAIVTPTDVAASLSSMELVGASALIVEQIKALAVYDDLAGIGVIAKYSTYTMKTVVWGLSELFVAMAYAYVAKRLALGLKWFIPAFVLAFVALLTLGVTPAIAALPIVPFVYRGTLDQLRQMKRGVRVVLPDDPGIGVEEKILEETGEHVPGMRNDLERFHRPYQLVGLMVFGFVNGVPLGVPTAVSLPIIAGFTFGKPIGLLVGHAMAVYATKPFGKWAIRAPKDMNTWELAVTSPVAGIGLTVAVFLAWKVIEDEALREEAILGILIASMLSFVNFFVLTKLRRWFERKHEKGVRRPGIVGTH